MTTQELIDYYVRLVIIQYATKSRAVATIAAFVGLEIQDQIAAQVGDGFNFTVSPVGPQVHSAAGLQLEAVGSYRGAQRVYFGLAANAYFELPDAADPIPTGGWNGFMDAANPPSEITWLFVTSEDTRVPIYALTDSELYRLTQFRAKTQSSHYGLADIDAILMEFFGDNVAVIDNLNMTILYVDVTSDSDSLFTVVSISQSLPKPAGVRVQSIRAEMLSNFFGLQDAESSYDSSFCGFSDAETALTTGTFISAP